MESKKLSTLQKFLDILRYEKTEISSIYFYAILYGLVQLSVPIGVQSIISFVLSNSVSASLVLLVILVIVGVFVAGLLQVNQMKVIEKIEQQLFVRYAFKYAEAVPKMRLKDVDGYYLPELVNRFFDTISLQKGVAKLLLDIPAATLQILFGLILLAFYHPAFIFFGILLVLVLYLILRITGNRGLETSMEESNYKYRVAGYLQELARGVTTFKFAANSNMPISNTDKYVSGYLRSRTAHFKILLLQYWTLIAFKIMITASMLIVGVYLLLNQQLNIGQFIAAEIVILSIISSVEKLITNLDKVYDALTSVEKLHKVTEKPNEHNGSMTYMPDTGMEIKLDHLSFSYTGSKQILNGITAHIGKGEKICVRGRNGSGKSTLLKLLGALHEDYEGSLSSNGIQYSAYNKSSLRSNIGVLLESQDIIEGTVKDNICMGNDSISYIELTTLANIVGLSSFVDSLKDGFDHQLQTAGQRLSTKVVRKILLMRALIHRPPLILMEEPWLVLEEGDAERVKNYLLRGIEGSTVIIVTDDTSCDNLFDQIIVLEKGKVESIQKPR